MNTKRILSIVLLLLFTSTAYIHTFHNGWTTWDDDVYVTDNHFIRDITAENLVAIWTKSFNGSYLPLTLMSYMVDYAIGGYNPAVYHTINLLFHIINVVLVYVLSVRLSNGSHLTGFVVALIFGIHPMHVESVAWISGRKDMVSGMFFLLSVIAYLNYIQQAQQKGLVLSFIFFTLALYSKITVVMLPFVLILLDIYIGRTWRWNLVYEKLFFFLIAIVFVVIGYFAQYTAGALRHSSLLEMLLMPHYSLFFYIYKFFLPIQLSSYYPYPKIDEGMVPIVVYLSLPIVYVIFYLVWENRSSRHVVFGFLFFLLLVFPVLQHIRFSGIIAADRFTYLPYIGLAFPIGVLVEKIFQRSSKQLRMLSITIGIILCAAMFALTFHRVQVWKDSNTLWNDVLKKYPDAFR
ncbi:MAG: hypothetical protein AB1600_08385 [Bacteroidota bacterium]